MYFQMDKISKRRFTKRTEQQKLDLIDQWEKSGLAIKTFCDQHQFSDSLFHAWLNKYRRNKKTAGTPKDFIAIQVASADLRDHDSPSLFAEVITIKGNQLKLYQAVSVDFLQKLIS